MSSAIEGAYWFVFNFVTQFLLFEAEAFITLPCEKNFTAGSKTNTRVLIVCCQRHIMISINRSPG